MRLIIKRKDLEKILKLAENSEIEVCGFLLGKNSDGAVLVETVRETANRLNSPVEFEIDPPEIAEVLDEAEKMGLEIVGIFHSHLGCPPVPSEKDFKGMELWRNVWLIVTSSGDFRAWVLRGENLGEVEIEVTS
ncbi:M67 family metallopeptidase [Thermococcus gorgonarius]|uniref:Metalloprotease n=1 Tax=Thermococcus gorgonarius TaxID=71997 RepID=A0A2Z2M534_THEGO|nr:M67 family metallopeptidase [Thermococcus gorgonarius]ASJ00546.1 metalloprotease [Thermococcus gorgonarius]